MLDPKEEKIMAETTLKGELKTEGDLVWRLMFLVKRRAALMIGI